MCDFMIVLICFALTILRHQIIAPTISGDLYNTKPLLLCYTHSYIQYIIHTLTSLVATTALEAVLSMIAKAVDEKTFMMICNILLDVFWSS